MSCTSLIHSRMDSLTETEQRLAAYLLEHPVEVTRLSAKEYAQTCTSSPAAVVRFSRKLGFKGFTDLKIDLARESVRQDVFQSAIHDNDDMETIVKKAKQLHLRNTTATYDMINLATLNDAIDAICSAKKIHLFGVGASGLVAMDFLLKSSRIGIPAYYYMDSQTNIAAAALLGPGDAAIAISYSGETAETILPARTAVEQGARLIAITQAMPNTLNSLADYSLYVPSEESEFRVGAMTSRTSGLLILDLLYLGFVQRNPQRAESDLGRTRKLIMSAKVK